jgi:hypothetical protein
MKTILSLLGMIMFFGISCKKNSTSDQNNSTDPLRLKKFVIIDPTQTAPFDTLSTYKFEYDNLGRCIKMSMPVLGIDDGSGVYNFYRGNETVISERKIQYSAPMDSIREFFTYSATGEMISDSVLDYSGATPNIYSTLFNRQNNIVYSSHGNNSAPRLLGIHHQQKDSRGNFVAERDSSFSATTPGNYSFRDGTNSSISYDDKPCPFYNLFPHWPVVAFFDIGVMDYMPIYESSAQANNIIRDTRTVFPSSTGLAYYDEEYIYTYNANGYPETVIIKFLDSGEEYKAFYYYY